MLDSSKKPKRKSFKKFDQVGKQNMDTIKNKQTKSHFKKQIKKAVHKISKEENDFNMNSSKKINIKNKKHKKIKKTENKVQNSNNKKFETKLKNSSTNIKGNSSTNIKGNSSTNIKGNSSTNIKENLVDASFKDTQVKANPLKRKSDNSITEDSPSKRMKLFHLKKKERKTLRKKHDNKKFEVKKKLKLLWEEFRQSHCTSDRKNVLLEEVCAVLKGQVKEFSFAHDTVRVLECILATGTEAHRTFLFEEMKDDLAHLVKSKYGKYFLIKMLRYGTKEQKNTIVKSLYGKVVELIRHTEAAQVVEIAYNECANAAQRSELVQEFYGPSFKYFKDLQLHSLKEIFDKMPDKKPDIIQHLKEALLKILDKSVVKHSIVHHVLLQFMMHSDALSRSEIIEAMREIIPEILHTKDGSKVAMYCIWHGSAKDRKIIVKHMKPFVTKIAIEEYGHMVLLSIFDVVDDTKLVEKHIISELVKNLLEISQNKYGKKVLIYLINPREPHYFSPDVINFLKLGDNNAKSKKEAATRQSELKTMISQHLLELVKNNIKTLHNDNPFCLLVIMILKYTTGNKNEAYQAISELFHEVYSMDKKNLHAIEHPGTHFLLKQLIIDDKNVKDMEKSSFSEYFVKSLPEGIMKSWINCNRGTFILVSLFETGIPVVVERINHEMQGLKKELSRKPFKGAEILLKYLKHKFS